MNKKQLIKDMIEYILIFLFLLFVSIYTTPFSNDEVWNYGFAHNLYTGLIPYKDFNMIVTPFYPFMMSLPFYIFGSNLLVFQITNILILIGTFVLIKKMIGNYQALFICTLVFPSSILFPSYNLFVFTLLVLLIYCEKYVEKNDIWIGLLLGFMILTKQTVGVMVLFASLFLQRKDLRRMGKRFLYCMIPISIFVIYVICTHSFYDFIDQCFLGMLDFGNKNTELPIIEVLFSMVLLLEVIFFIRKDPKKIENYYILSFYSILIPMFNLYHIQIALLGMILLTCLNISLDKYKKYLSILSLGIAIGVHLIIYIDLPKPLTVPNSVPHFEYRYIYAQDIQYVLEITSYLKEHSDDSIIFLSRETYFIKLANNKTIGRLDLINYGNSGYHGTEQLIQMVKKNKDAYFITYEKDICSHSQTDCDVIRYVLDHYEKVGEIGPYSIYH